jgi:hypothetical protein
VFEKGAGAAGLYARFVRERPQRPLLEATAGEFRERFEKAYADEMDWRNARGGVTEEEIRAIALASGEHVDPETVARLREVKAAEALTGLDEALRERFVRETTLTAAEWEGVRDRLVFVHDRLPAEAGASILAGAGAREEGHDQEEHREWDRLRRRFHQGNPRTAFAEENLRLPEGRRFVKIGELSEPIGADVYRSAAAVDLD